MKAVATGTSVLNSSARRRRHVSGTKYLLSQAETSATCKHLRCKVRDMIRWMPAANSVWAVALHVIVLVLAWPLGVLSALYYFPDIIAYTISCFISRDNMTDLSSKAKLLQRGVHPKALDEMSTSSSGNELDMDEHELAADWDSAYIDGDGCRLHARIAGSAGPLMLLVHGFPECSYSWRH